MALLRRSIAAALFLPVLPFVLSACGHKAQALDDEHGASGSAAPKPADTPLTENDLQDVCAGKGQARAKAYAKDAAAAHALVAFQRGADAKAFDTLSIRQLADYHPEKPEDAELVACVVRTGSKMVSTCDFDNTPPTRYLDMHEATYEISIRDAKSAAVVASRNVTLPAEGCPMFHSFKAERDIDYPDVDFALADLAKTVVVPAAGGAGLKLPNPDAARDKLSDTDLDKVCYGLPEPRAAEYAKVPGKVSPTLFLSRTGANAPFKKSFHPDLKPWEVEDAQQYQLVICTSETSREKKKECKFDDKEPVHFLDLYSASYEVTLREARTGKVLLTKPMTEKAGTSCPSMWLFHSLHDNDVPQAEKAIMDLVRTFAEPK